MAIFQFGQQGSSSPPTQGADAQHRQLVEGWKAVVSVLGRFALGERERRRAAAAQAGDETGQVELDRVEGIVQTVKTSGVSALPRKAG